MGVAKRGRIKAMGASHKGVRGKVFWVTGGARVDLEGGIVCSICIHGRAGSNAFGTITSSLSQVGSLNASVV